MTVLYKIGSKLVCKGHIITNFCPMGTMFMSARLQ
jgi:hypothetical protein